MPLIVAQGTNTVTGPGTCSVTLDTTGATIIYIIGFGTFGVSAPGGGGDYDAGLNTWISVSNPISTCNGGMEILRVSSPVTSATHTFSFYSGYPYPIEVVVVAFHPDFSDASYIRNSAVNGGESHCNPVKSTPLPPIANNFIFIAAAHGGCGWVGGAPAIDSGFTILYALQNLGVAYLNLGVAATVDPTWTALSPGGVGGSTGAAVLEGFGVFVPSFQVIGAPTESMGFTDINSTASIIGPGPNPPPQTGPAPTQCALEPGVEVPS